MSSIYKALASLDLLLSWLNLVQEISSIHKALASLDHISMLLAHCGFLFDPQGSREPRHINRNDTVACECLRSTRLSRASTTWLNRLMRTLQSSIHKALASHDFHSLCSIRKKRSSIHKALASLDIYDWTLVVYESSSIHKALASLDRKNAQLFLHLCHIYMLHIIHLLQIVYQVEISSRNLIVFSGQL